MCMAPEAWGAGAGTASDVWSLGVIMYALLTLWWPCDCEDDDERFSHANTSLIEYWHQLLTIDATQGATYIRTMITDVKQHSDLLD